MVRGLFPASEQEPVMEALEKSAVFVTSLNIEELLANVDYLSSAWTLANLYLCSMDAELLGPDALRIVGLVLQQFQWNDIRPVGPENPKCESRNPKQTRNI